MRMTWLSTLALLAVATATGAQQPSASIVQTPEKQAGTGTKIISYSGPIFFPTDPNKRPAYKAAWVLTQKAMKLSNQKDWSAAIPLFQEALATYPDSPVDDGGLALAYTGLGRTEDALSTYRRLFYGWPGRDWSSGVEYWGDTPQHYAYMVNLEDSAALLLRFALLLEQTKQSAEAVAVYRRAYPHLPTDRGPLPPEVKATVPTANFLEAVTRTGLSLVDEDRDDALVQVQTATSLQPDLAVAYYHQGLLLKDRDGRAGEAVEAFQKASLYGGAEIRSSVRQAMQTGSSSFMTAEKAAQGGNAP